MTGKFITQAAFARSRKVSRKTATTWKQKGLLVIRPADGLVNVAASDKRLSDHGVTLPTVTSVPKNNEGNSKVTAQGNTGNTREGAAALRPLSPGQPCGYAILDQIDQPFDAGAMSMGLSIFYRIGPDVAGLAVAAGASCKVAYSLERTVRFALMIHLIDHAELTGSEALKAAVKSEFIDMDAFAETNWPGLAALAGEQVDLAAWHRYHASKFAGPGKLEG